MMGYGWRGRQGLEMLDFISYVESFGLDLDTHDEPFIL